MRGALIYRDGVASTHALKLQRLLAGPQYAQFGCPVRGLHVDDNPTACRRCAYTPENTHDGHGTAQPFTDDRGRADVWWEPWEHTRWLDRFGRLHREDDRPALIADSLRVWADHGRVRRGGGKPAITGYATAYTDEFGRLHREGTPALVAGADREYWSRGRLHRADGAACISTYDASYWHKGEPVTREQLWARWCATHGRVALDNAAAQSQLYELTVSSEDPGVAFPPLDHATVAAVLRVHPNLTLALTP